MSLNTEPIRNGCTVARGASERAQAALRALESLSLDASPKRYPSADKEPCCEHEAEVERRGHLIHTLHDRVRILEHALHLPPYGPPPSYSSVLRPYSPLPLPADKDLAIRRLLSDNRLLRDAVVTLQRAVREYELHVSRLMSAHALGAVAVPLRRPRRRHARPRAAAGLCLPAQASLLLQRPSAAHRVWRRCDLVLSESVLAENTI